MSTDLQTGLYSFENSYLFNTVRNSGGWIGVIQKYFIVLPVYTVYTVYIIYSANIDGVQIWAYNCSDLILEYKVCH